MSSVNLDIAPSVESKPLSKNDNLSSTTKTLLKLSDKELLRYVDKELKTLEKQDSKELKEEKRKSKIIAKIRNKNQKIKNNSPLKNNNEENSSLEITPPENSLNLEKENKNKNKNNKIKKYPIKCWECKSKEHCYKDCPIKKERQNKIQEKILQRQQEKILKKQENFQ